MNRALIIVSVLILPGAVAQNPPQPAQQLSPEQLENLVAPIALYPDPLLGQALAASTYPLEIVEAKQWLDQHPDLRGQQLVDTARQQSWDPSVQALVAFPDALTLLSSDVQWTTDLGNAFLAQQTDVMSAIQRMRARAQQNGRLQSTAQQVVTTQPMSNGDPAIQIQPADPQVIYVPVYNPVYVWGPPVWGAYPPLGYPGGFGFGFGAACFLGGLFAGLLTWGGWGCGLNWLAHALFVNTLFFNHYGYSGYSAAFHGAYGGTVAWSHNPVHRMGVAYPNHTLAGRYGSYSSHSGAYTYSARTLNASRGYAVNSGGMRSYSSPRNYSAPAFSGRNYASPGSSGRSYSSPAPAFSGRSSSSGNYSARSNTGGGYSARNFGAPSQSARSSGAPRGSGGNVRAPSQHFSAPRSSGGSSRGSSGHRSSGHSGGSSRHH